MVDINLLPQNIRAAENETKLAGYLKIGGAIFLAISVIFLVVSLVIFFITKGERIKSEAKITSLTSQLQAGQNSEKSAVLLVNKGAELIKIMQQTPRYSKLLTTLSQKVPAEVNISELTITSPVKISAAGDSGSYLSLSQFLKVITADTSGIFGGVSLQNVVLSSQTGRVQFVLDITIKEKSLII